MSKRNTWLTVRLTVDERERVVAIARRSGYKGITPFVIASLLRSASQAETLEELRSAEKREAATLSAIRAELARLQRTEYVVFAMVENLAKIILTCMPPTPAEPRQSAVALGRAAYERYLKAVGISLHNDSKAAVERLAGADY